MRGMDENFNEENCIDTLRILSGNKKLNEMSHTAVTQLTLTFTS